MFCITHCHADHCHGIDDLRPLVKNNNGFNVYAKEFDMNLLAEKFHYIFLKDEQTIWQKFNIERNILNHNKSFKIGNVTVRSFLQNHGKIDSTGFLFNDKVAYCTDVKRFPDESFGLHSWRRKSDN